MKIDFTKIEGFETMTAEEKLAAIEAMELPDPDMSGFVKKDLLDRANSEAANYKRQLREKMSEGEMIRCFEDIGYLNRWKLQQQTTRHEFPVFVFRLGKAVFATNPFELYVDYSIRMKARCKARQAFIIQLSSNAKGGYLPTQAAVDGGSYGSKPVSTMVGPAGGDELVEKTLAAMDSLF